MSPVQTIETEPTQSFMDWYTKNRKIISIAAALLAMAAAGAWFYMRSNQIKAANAERGLGQARQSLAAGNAPLAITDLQRVATRYESTPAGVQAAMLLAQLQYDQGKFAEGIQALDGVADKADENRAAVLSLIADGHVAQNKPDEAVAAYRRAAEAAEGPGERSLYMAKAGRVLMMAGKNQEAKAVWEALAKDPDALAVQNEAQVRLGELAAQPAGKS